MLFHVHLVTQNATFITPSVTLPVKKGKINHSLLPPSGCRSVFPWRRSPFKLNYQLSKVLLRFSQGFCSYN